MVWKIFSFPRVLCLTLILSGAACAPFTSPSQIVPSTRTVCAPRPTRPSETLATFTRDSHPKSPTPAPSPTSGPPPPTTAAQPAPTLAQPLNTKEMVLGYLLEKEIRSYAEWDEPWCLETLQTDPTRIDVQRFNSVEEAESTMGGWGPNQPQEPAWIVTIQGGTYISGPGYSGRVAYVRYTVGERTGMYYMSEAGRTLPPPTLAPPKTHAPRTPKPRTPRAKGTPTVLMQTRVP